MSMDFIGDQLTAIRNAVMARNRTVKIRYSRIMNRIVEIMKEYGFISDFVVENGENNKKYITITLKYSPRTGEPAIRGIKRVSTPGRHIYVGKDTLPVVKNNLGIAILTTDKGVMTERECRKRKIGGEIICYIW